MVEGISLLIGLIMPIIIEFVNTKIKAEKRWLKYTIALASCLVAGTLTTCLVEEIRMDEWDKLLGNIGAVFVASQTAYNLYWKGSGLQKKLVALA